MGFAQPLALAFLGLSIPVILLYLLKQRRRRVLVSTLMFWDKILQEEHRVTSITRLRKLISLLLQLLFIFFLAMAIARPMLSRDLLGSRRIVLFVDVSASMTAMESDGTRFDEAKDLAEGVAKGMSIGDDLMLVAVGADVDVVTPFTDSRKEVLDKIDTLTVTHGTTDFAEAFAMLDNLPPDERETHIYVISDGAFDAVSLETVPNAKWAYLTVGSESDNVGITAFQVRPLPSAPRDFEILFEITNDTEEEVTIPYEVQVDGGLVDAAEVTLAAATRDTRIVRQFSGVGGVVHVSLDHVDAFTLDNSAYALLPEPDPIPVVLVTAGNLFLETALATDDRITLSLLSPVDYEENDRSAVYIFDRWSPKLPPSEASIFITQWPNVIAPPTSGTLTDPIITDWERDHPVNRHLTLSNVTINEALRTETPDGFEALISSFENPLVLYRDHDVAPVMLVAFDTTSSDLPLRVAFPIMLANAVRHMANADRGDTWASVELGTFIDREDAMAYIPEQNQSAFVGLLAPGETSDQSDPATSALTHVSRVGIYEGVMEGGEQLPLFAANLTERRESAIAPAEDLPIESEKPLELITGGFRLGAEPWGVLAALAFALSMAEWFLFHRRVIE
jgi:hypothetical protein